MLREPLGGQEVEKVEEKEEEERQVEEEQVEEEQRVEEEQVEEEQVEEVENVEAVGRSHIGTAVCRRSVWVEKQIRSDQLHLDVTCTGFVQFSPVLTYSDRCVALISGCVGFRGMFPGMIKSFGCTS